MATGGCSDPSLPWRPGGGTGSVARVESHEDAQLIERLPAPVVDVAGAYPWTPLPRSPTTMIPRGGEQGNTSHRADSAISPTAGWWTPYGRTRRLRGFQAVVRGIDPAPAVFEESLPWWETVDTSGRLRSWLGGLRRPVGVFAANDTAGLRLADLCRDSRYSGPGLPLPSSASITRTSSAR